jgi:pilus assembly protein FimV
MKLRKLTSALIAAGALSSPFALGLGLGDIKLKSALNQPLQAEIKLLQTRELAEEEILPGLAGQADFDRAGVERFFFLSDIDFDVEVTGKGDGSLLLTTKQSIQEPFLNFLVEVNWPNGRVLREYTVLLDPPVYEEDLVQEVVVTPKATSAPKLETVAPSKQVSQQRNTQAVVTPTASTDSSAEGTYGPVKSTDTLWDIALSVRPSRSVTVQQTMMSIHDLNPNAFVAGNINKLKKGSVLRIPSQNQIENWKQGSAIEQVAAHNQRYKSSITPGSDSAATSPVPLSGVDQVVTPVEAAPEEARLKIVRSDTDNSATGVAANGQQEGSGAEIETLENELAITQENLDKANRENEKLAARLQALEDQMSKLSRLVTLKDTQMAELQLSAADVSQEDGPAVSSEVPGASDDMKAPMEDGVVDPVAPDMVDSDVVESSELVTETGVVESDVDETAPDMVGEPEGKTTEESATSVTPPAVDAQDESLEKPTIKGEETVKVATQEPEQSLIDKIMTNPVWLSAVGAGSLLFVILLFILSRRSYQRESELFDVMDKKGGVDSKDPLTEVDLDSFDQDLDNLDLDAQSFGQVDLASDQIAQTDNIITRADSFIAYGQFDNAVGLLEEAINQEAGRTDLRLKLLEVYAEMQDTQGFERQKKEILDIGADDVLEQINVLEQKLPGYVGGAAAVSAFDSGESLASAEPLMGEDDLGAATTESDDFSYSLEDLESEITNDLGGDSFATPAGLEQEDNENGIDLSSDGASDDIEFNLDQELGLDESSLDGDLNIEFEMPEDEAVSVDQPVAAPLEEVHSGDGIEALDDLEVPDFGEESLEELTAAAATEGSDEIAQDESGDELQLDEFDFDASLSSDESEGDASLDLDDVDLDLSSALELDQVEESEEVDVPAVEDNMLGGLPDDETQNLDELDLDGLDLDSVAMDETVGDVDSDTQEDLDMGADLEDLAKSLGVDSLDEVDLDAELASASDHVEDEVIESASDVSEDISLDLSEDDVLEDVQAESAEDVSLEETSLDEVSLDELSLDEPSLEVMPETSEDKVDIDSIDVDGVAIEEKTPESIPDDLVTSELEGEELDFYVGTDEVATKLDLARAYVDMGDADGARDILEEVMLEGNDTQKSEASELLNGLS